MAKAKASVKASKRNFTKLDDGTRIVLDDMWSYCDVCHQIKPMSDFGMRRMDKPEGEIRREPRCKSCRRVSRKGEPYGR